MAACSASLTPARTRSRHSQHHQEEEETLLLLLQCHLEELDPDAGEHELQQSRDDHDVSDRPDGHEHTLDHVLQHTGDVLNRHFLYSGLKQSLCISAHQVCT